MFFSIFSGRKQDSTSNFNLLLLKLTLLTLLLLLPTLPLLPLLPLPTQKALLSILLCLIMCLLAFIALSTYRNLPNDNNQMEQSIWDTKEYLRGLN